MLRITDKLALYAKALTPEELGLAIHYAIELLTDEPISDFEIGSASKIVGAEIANENIKMQIKSEKQRQNAKKRTTSQNEPKRAKTSQNEPKRAKTSQNEPKKTTIYISDEDIKEIVERWNTTLTELATITEDEATRAFANCNPEVLKEAIEAARGQPFLMGHGPRKWKMSPFWLAKEENQKKVLAHQYKNTSNNEQPTTNCQLTAAQLSKLVDAAEQLAN